MGTGDKIRVTVVEVDLVRKRIALSAKSKPEAKGAPRAENGAPGRAFGGRPERRPQPQSAPKAEFSNNAFARLLKK